MTFFELVTRPNAPHALLLTTDRIDAVCAELKTVLPEVLIHTYDFLSMEDALALREMYRTEGVRTLVLVLYKINTEAQQALLTFFEEAAEGIRIIVLLPHGVSLLPTIRSRFVVFTEQTQSVASASFYTQSLTERIATITALEDAPIDTVTLFVRGLFTDASAVQKERILFVLQHLSTQGVSRKMLLELLAYTL